jgi:hypothetical protein
MQNKNRLVVADAGWAQDLPDWLLEEITAERLTLAMAALVREMADHEKVGNAEMVAYFMTASLRAPLIHEDAEIYVYLTAKLMQRKGKELADFMQAKIEQGLSDDENRKLTHMKTEIFYKRGGDIESPILKILRELKKSAAEEKADPQLSFF